MKISTRAARALFLFFLLAAALLQVTPVSAHAELVRSVPEANAHLDRAPTRIDLYFSEAFEPNLKDITLYNSSGARVDTGLARLDPADPTHLFVILPALPDGIYLVTWKIVDVEDGHLTGGAFPISIGSAPAGAADQAGMPAAASGPATPPEALPGQVLVKSLLYLAAALLAGGAIFLRFVWQPASTRLAFTPPLAGQLAFDRFVRRSLTAALILFGLTTLLGVLVQAGAFQGQFMDAPWDPPAFRVLTGSRYGLLALARLAAVLALAGTLLPPPSQWNRWAALVFLEVALLTISLGSHAAAQLNGFMLAADLAHLTAASLWVGGLGLFLAGLWFTRRAQQPLRNCLAALILVRFSTLAGISLAVLVLTGVYQSLTDVGSWTGLWQSDYGRVLLVKLAAAAVLAGLGGYNHFFMRPQIQQAGPTDAQPLQRFLPSLWFEAALGAALLAWVGLFTSLPPANPNAAIPVLTRSIQVDDLRLRLLVTPARAGVNTFSLDLHQAAGGAVVQNASGVDLEFYPSNDSIPPSTVQLSPAGPGRFTGQGAFLSFPDRWQVRAVVHRPAVFDSYADFTIPLAATPAPLPYSQLSAVLAVCILLAGLFAGRMMVRKPPRSIPTQGPEGFQNL